MIQGITKNGELKNVIVNEYCVNESIFFERNKPIRNSYCRERSNRLEILITESEVID